MCLVLIFALSFISTPVLNANEGEINVTIDGELVNFDVAPQIIGGRTMVPMRAILEALGAGVEWYGDAQTIVATTASGEVIHLGIGSNTVIVNNRRIDMDVAPIISDGRTLVPARFVAEAMGMSVEWDERINTVAITLPHIQQVIAGVNNSFALTDNGVLWRWQGFIGELSPSRDMDNVSSVSVGEAHTMVIRDDGSLWGFGCNQFGKLGDGTDVWRHTPVKVMEDVVSVSAGKSHTMVIRTDGSLWAWGGNYSGQLGDGTTEDRFNPVRIMNNVAAVSAGDSHTMAIRTDGSLWVWGDNGSGQIGAGDYGVYAVYHDVGEWSSFESTPAVVDVYGNHVIEIFVGERDVEWFSFKQLTPVRVMGGVVSISAGSGYSMAIGHDGALWAWGRDAFISPEYGWITSEIISRPMRVMNDVVSASSGVWHNMALRADGSLWVWGINEHGNFGDGTNISRRIPIRIMDDVSYVSAGGRNTMVIRNDGSVWGWGERFDERPIELMGATRQQ